MHARATQLFLAVSVVATALGTGACRKSAADQRREAEQATAEAEQTASQTTLTSASVAGEGNSEANDEAREGQDRALREHAEAIVAARNEQLEYRSKLQGALDHLDAKRRDAKKRGPVHVKAIDARREVLKHDLDALDRTTDQDWAALKAKIDRDLRDHAGDREEK